MSEKRLTINSVEMKFLIEAGLWQLELAKSQTRVKDIRQLALLKENSDLFVPVETAESEDTFSFLFKVGEDLHPWETARRLSRSEKLRLLCNLARFRKSFGTRMTCFFHPNNLVFDDNLIPYGIYRGIRGLLPPFTYDETTLLLQYKCLTVALFSKKYQFDELFAGSLNHAKETEFERQVIETEDFDALFRFLHAQYLHEKKTAERTMQTVPKKRFRLFKRLSYIMIAVSILLAVPLAYYAFAREPYQQHLLSAHRDFLSEDYAGVINDLNSVNPEKLPAAGKYILAYSYVKSENLNDDEKTAVMNNISLKSDTNYLLYWIYNGRGDLNRSLDLAMYIDDPVLIIYAYIKKMEKAKNDPDLSGTERENKVAQYEAKLKSYGEKYGLESLIRSDSDTDDSTDSTAPSQNTSGQNSKNTTSDQKAADEKADKTNAGQQKDEKQNK
nr:type VII secretion protein EssB [Heyndrickxia acidiproducens]